MNTNSLSAIERETKKLKDKIVAIEEEMAKLAIEKSSLANQLFGMELALRLLNKPSQMSNSFKSKSLELRPNSEVSKVYNVLREAGYPLHIDAILEKLGHGNDNKKKLSLVGSLASYVKSKRIFERCGPNIFGLLEAQDIDIKGEYALKSDNAE